MTKKSKTLIILTSLTLFVAILIPSAWAINRYVYDWFHSVNIFPCSEKGISMINENSHSEADLDELLDLSKLAIEMKDFPEYKVSVNNPSLDLFIERKFAGKEYTIMFDNYNSRKTTYYKIISEYYLCTDPAYPIKKNTDELINGLPFTETLKKKIRDNIYVTNFFRFYAG